MKNDLDFDPKRLAEALRKSRELAHISFRQLAADSGVSTSQILRIESGEFECYISSMIRICGALGIRFGELIERCVLPNYELYRVAIEREFKTDYPQNLPSDAHSKEACKDLVSGGISAIIHLLRTSNVQRSLSEIFFPGNDLFDHFKKIASSIQIHPPTLRTRTTFFEKLQGKPLSTLIRFYKFPTADQIASHAARQSASRMRHKGLTVPWFPIVWTEILPQSEEIDLFYVAPSEKNVLTNKSKNRKYESVSNEMEYLLEDVRELVTKKGAKAKLAEYLEVPQSRLSEWLSGEHEPGGRITLRLLHWVKQQRRPNKKSPEA